MDYEKTIEIPFGAYDSELKGWEYTIPEGMEAEIKDGKIIVKQKESEHERIRKFICSIIDNLEPKNFVGVKKMNVLAWLERAVSEEYISFALATQVLAKYGYSFILNEDLAELKKVFSQHEEILNLMKQQKLEDAVLKMREHYYKKQIK